MDLSPRQFGFQPTCAFLGFIESSRLNHGLYFSVLADVEAAEGEHFIELVSKPIEFLWRPDKANRLHKRLDERYDVVRASVMALPYAKGFEEASALRDTWLGII